MKRSITSLGLVKSIWWLFDSYATTLEKARGCIQKYTGS